MTAKTRKKQVQNQPRPQSAAQAAENDDGGLESKLTYFILEVLKPHAGAVALTLLAILVVLIGGYYWTQQRQEKSAEILSEVSATEELNELERLSEDYSGSKAGELAVFKAAAGYYEEEEYDKAMKYFDTLLSSYPKSTFRTEAELGKAYAHEAMGDYQKASDQFAETAETADVDLKTKVEAYYGAGRNAAALQKTEKAIELYKKALNIGEEGFYYNRVKTAMQHLQTG